MKNNSTDQEVRMSNQETIINIPQNVCPVYIKDIDPATGKYRECSLVFHKQALETWKKMESYSPKNTYTCLVCKGILSEEEPAVVVTVTENKYQKWMATVIAIILILIWVLFTYFPQYLKF